MDNNKIGKRIRDARKNAHLTQIELGERIGKTESSIRKYEKGLVQIPFDVLSSISEVLNVRPDSLLGLDDFKEFESFVLYLKSLGYLVDSEVTKWHYEDVIENGVIVGQGQVEDESYIIVNSKNNSVKATFTQEEFKALQQQSRANIEGAILLQSQKNKKEKPSSAATDNGSSNENTIK